MGKAEIKVTAFSGRGGRRGSLLCLGGGAHGCLICEIKFFFFV